jgi:ribonuclease-3 family protein
MATELFSPLMTETEARLKTPLALAYIGDTVWDLLVRRSLLTGGWKAGMLHKQAVKQVNAAAQAEAMRVIRPHLTEAEEDIVRRGSNAHAKHAAPKNQDPADYSLATGLEALMGYLYLSGQMERIGEIFDIAQAIH